MKEIESTKERKCILCSGFRKVNIVYNAPITKSHLESQCNPHQNTTGILYIKKNNHQFI